MCDRVESSTALHFGTNQSFSFLIMPFGLEILKIWRATFNAKLECLLYLNSTIKHCRRETYFAITDFPSEMQRIASCSFSRPHPNGSFTAEIILPFLSSKDGSFPVAMSAWLLSSGASFFDQVMRADNLKSQQLLDYTLTMLTIVMLRTVIINCSDFSLLQ